MTPSPGIEPGEHWWEASALTTAPSLHHIDAMTFKLLNQSQNPPRIQEFYTLTKIHSPNPVGRPIVFGSGGPTERISSFIDSLLQHIAKKQESYIKDTTDFVRFIENSQLPDNAIIATLDVCSLYTNIPQEEGMEVCTLPFVTARCSTRIGRHLEVS